MSLHFGWNDLEDDLSSDCPRYAITPEMIAKVHIFLEGHRFKLREIAEVVGKY